MFTHLRVIHSSVNKRNQNKTRTCQLIFVNDFKFDSQILECESTRKVYIAYTNWCVNRMMQEKERTTIHLELLQVGLTSFLVSRSELFWLRSSRASDKVGKSLQVGFFWKSAIHRVQDQFSETVYPLTSWIRILKQLPTLKTQNTGKSHVKVYTGTAQVCFWIVVYTTKCYKNSILVCNRKKNIRVTYRQMNASVFLLREVNS